MEDTTRMEAIQGLNNQASLLLAAGKYDEAINTLSSGLQQLLSHTNLTFLNATFGDTKTLPDVGQEQASLDYLTTNMKDLVSSTSHYYPLPTCIMGPPDEDGGDIFRECFTVQQKVPMEPGATFTDADEMLIALTLYFNLGVCHHRRGLSAMKSSTMTSTPPIDLHVAESIYRFALQVLDPREPLPAYKQPSHSAYWLLILAVINNLGCIAFSAADHGTVQCCLKLGLHAMESINLPISWNNQYTWCNPSPAA